MFSKMAKNIEHKELELFKKIHIVRKRQYA